MKEARRIACIPVSWPTGLGEYARLLTIARYGLRRWPETSFRFVLNRHAQVTPPPPFEASFLDTSPTFDTPGVRSILRSYRPHLILFDNTGRTAQLRCARTLGARTVYLSTRAKQRRHGLLLRMLRLPDEHWIVDPPIGRTLSGWQTAGTQALGVTRVRYLQSVFAPPDPDRADRLMEKLGLHDRGYALFVAGGGGGVVNGRWAVDVFAEAAQRATGETGIASVVLQGRQYAGPRLDYPGVQIETSLHHEETVDLVERAALVVAGASSTSFQALAQKKVIVATSTGGEEQAARVRRWARYGIWEPADLDASSLSSKVTMLLSDSSRFQAIEDRVRALGLTNGLDQALDAIERLLVPDTVQGASDLGLPGDVL